MPLISDRNDIVLPDLTQQPLIDDNNMPVPEMSKTFGAAFRIDNTIGALAANKSRGNGSFDPAFNWSKSFEGLPLDYQLDYGKNFALAENEEHFNAIKEQIDQEQTDRSYLASSGWRGVAAELSAGLLDPLNLVPIGGSAVKVGRGAKGVLEGSAKIAMVGTGAATAQELALHSQEETRTLGESAANVSVAALLSGVLGAGSYALLSKDVNYPKMVEGLEKDFRLDDFTPKQPFYHGTTADFEHFDPTMLGSNTGAKSAKEGFFFSSNPEVAKVYAERGATFKALSKNEYEEYVSLAGLDNSLKQHPETVSPSLKKRFDDEGQSRLVELQTKLDASPSYVKKVSLNYSNPKTVDLQGAERQKGDFTNLIAEAKNMLAKTLTCQ